MGFEFLAIVRNGPETGIYRISPDEEIGQEMARAFTIPAEKWLEPEMQRAAFNEEYRLADNEIFEIQKFALPPDLLNAVRFPHEYSEFDAGAKGIADLKAVAAVNTDGGQLTAIFKAIGKTKKLEPSRSMLLVCADKKYAKQDEPGIILDEKIAAVYQGGALLFRSPSQVKQFASLKAYMKEANDLEISAFLESKFEADTDKVLATADSWMRKRFAAIMESKLLDERTAVDIYETAKDFSAEIPVELSRDRNKLVLPAEKQDLRRILKFLNEEYYKGVLTGKDYQTGSKRPLSNTERTTGPARKKELSFTR